MHKLTKKTMTALLASCLLLIASNASAANAETEKAKKQFRAAQEAYQAEDYQTALNGFEKAYALRSLPGFLFNMAQCHTKLKNPVDAQRLYEKYLSQHPKAPNRPLVETLIAEAKTAVSANRKTKVATTPPPPPPPKHPKKLIAKAPVKSPAPATKTKLETKQGPKKKTAASKNLRAPRVKQLPKELELVPLVPKAPAVATLPAPKSNIDPVMAAPLPAVDMNAVMNHDTFYKRWWFWSLAGSVVAASVGAIVYAKYSPEEVVVLPSGSLGRSDQR